MNRPEPTVHFKLDLSARLILFQWKLIVVDTAQGVNIVYRYEFSDMPEGFIVQDFKILAREVGLANICPMFCRSEPDVSAGTLFVLER